MSNEDNLFGMEDLDDSRPTFDELRATPMSAPAKQARRKAKYNFMELPKEAVHCVKVYDRYGIEQKDVIEFDPETFEGVRMKDGSQQKIYLFNGYIEAAGVDQPDEEQLPEIIEHVRAEVIPEGRRLLRSASASAANRVDTLKTNLGENTPQGLKCPKCQSGIRFDDDQKAIVCSNGACDMKWHIDGEGVGKG